MHEIKFRSWNTEEFKMSFNPQIASDYAYYYQNEFEILMQYTGLKDKNGVEIYEGDIISVNSKYPKIVRWVDESACFCLVNISDLKDEDWRDINQQVSLVWWNDFKRDIKVIGNIYKNTELLEKYND